MILKFFRSSFFRHFIKWPLFFISRFVFVDLYAFAFDRSLIINGPKPDSLQTIRQIAENITIYAVICSIFYSITVGTGILTRFFVTRRSKQAETTSGDRWISFEENTLDHCIDTVRHIHFPMEALNLLYFMFMAVLKRTRLRMTTKIEWRPIIVHDFDAADDPAYPDCSLLHTIVLHVCNKCRAGNRLEIVRTSLFRQKSQSIHSWPLHPKFRYDPNGVITVWGGQSGGLMFIFVKCYGEGDQTSLDIYNTRTKAIYSIDTNEFPPDWSPAYFFRDHVDNEMPNTIYVRVINWRHGFGHLLFSLNIADPDQAPIVISCQEIYFPQYRSLSRFDNSSFHRSRGVIGFPVKLHLHGHENTVWQCLCVYDSKEKLVKFVSDFQIFHDDDPNWHVWMERFVDEIRQPLGLFETPCSPVCTPTEVLVLGFYDKSIWRTRFQPASLKNISAKRFFNEKEEKVKNLDEKKWRMATGVILNGHF